MIATKLAVLMAAMIIGGVIGASTAPALQAAETTTVNTTRSSIKTPL
jgi:hypothetical protein